MIFLSFIIFVLKEHEMTITLFMTIECWNYVDCLFTSVEKLMRVLKGEKTVRMHYANCR